MARQFESFIDSFCAYMKEKGSPPIFSRWAAIFAVSAAMERKVWIKTLKGVLYPNQYIIIVGPPGAGKTLATGVIRDMLVELVTDDARGLRVAPTSVSKASLIDAINDAKRAFINARPKNGEPAVDEFNSLTVLSNELGVFLPSYENDFMNVLTDIYDCRHYSETRRSAKINIKVERPQLNLIAATTPSYLNNLLPEGAWDQGFLSRTILVYSGAEEPGELFGEIAHDDATFQRLVSDIRDISQLYGRMEFTEEAAEAITSWHKAKGPPEPDHPKLTHYNTRRTAHLLKLCTIAAASTGNDRKITLEHYVQALDWLVEAEGVMPDIFKSMTTGGAGRAMEEAWHFVYTLYIKENKPIHESRLTRFLSERVPIHDVGRIIEVMEKAGIIIRKIDLEKGGQAFIPAAKRR